MIAARAGLFAASALVLLACAACTTTGSTRYLDTSCSVFSQLSYSSSKDSSVTVAEIRAFNRAYNSLCPPAASPAN